MVVGSQVKYCVQWINWDFLDSTKALLKSILSPFLFFLLLISVGSMLEPWVTALSEDTLTPNLVAASTRLFSWPEAISLPLEGKISTERWCRRCPLLAVNYSPCWLLKLKLEAPKIKLCNQCVTVCGTFRLFPRRKPPRFVISLRRSVGFFYGILSSIAFLL